MRRAILSLMLGYFVSANGAIAGPCDQVAAEPAAGSFTHECLHQVLRNFVLKNADGFFIFELSPVNNVYVQGIKSDKPNYFTVEIASARITDRISADGVRKLSDLGWHVSNPDPNYTISFHAALMLGGPAAELLIASLRLYEVQNSELDVTYMFGRF